MSAIAGFETLFRASVEKLYSTFNRYPLRERIQGCPCCVQKLDQAPMHCKPLRELSAKELGLFAWTAMTTIGDDVDFRHFLPRLLELMAGETWPDDREVLAGKLTYVNWLSWNDEEVTAVRHYLHALWDLELDSVPGRIETGALVCLVARAEDDLNPYLLDWRNKKTDAARHRLVELLVGNGEPGPWPWDVSQMQIHNAYWTDRGEQKNQLLDWLADPLTMDVVEVYVRSCSLAEMREWLEAARNWCTTPSR